MDKKRIQKRKKQERAQRLAQIPAHSLDAAPLISQIYHFDFLEWQGKLNGPGREQRKRLLDRYHSIKKARTLASLETPQLIPFDPEKIKQEKKVEKKEENATETTKITETNTFLLPPLPTEQIPSAQVLEALGLPPYQAHLESLLEEAYNEE